MISTKHNQTWEPHTPIEVEAAFDKFIESQGGIKISSVISPSPDFDNADYFLRSNSVVAELKELQTELEKSQSYNKGLRLLLNRAWAESPDWRPGLLGGRGHQPAWFNHDYIKIFKPHISRILKKANRQIRETKQKFDITTNAGLLLFVNDHFTHIPPQLTFSLICNLLQHSYSSIDCIVYFTVNRYVAIPGSKLANLIWMPAYSDKAEPWLCEFVNEFGAKWFENIQVKIGPFDESVQSDDSDFMNNASYIKHNLPRA